MFSPDKHLTQAKGSRIILTHKPALGEVDMTLHTKEYGKVIIAFDEEMLEEYTPWGDPVRHVVQVPHILFFALLVVSIGSMLGLILGIDAWTR